MRSGQEGREPLARIALILCVAGLHVYASWWLLFRFQVQVPRVQASMAGEADDEAVMLVRFIARVPEPADGSLTVTDPPSPTASVRAAVPAPVRMRPAVAAGETSAVFLPASGPPAPHRPLDLSVPERREPIGFDRPDPLASRAPVDPRRTRFADDWATDGDAVEKLKEDSLVARTLLGLFGGRDSCTGQAIRERRADCIGADYRPDLHEALRDR